MLSDDKEDEKDLKLTLFNYADTEMIKLSKNSVFHCLFVSDSYLNKFMDSAEVHSVFTLNLLERCIKETITSSTLLESVNAYNTVLHQEPFLQEKPCCLQKIHEY